MTLSLFFRAVIGASFTMLVLPGCSHFRTHTNYQKATEAKPLEIPPNLDSPATAGELIVPPANRNVGATSTTENRDNRPASLFPDTPPTTNSVIVSDEELHVDDTVENTWRRVGLALERAQLGTVVQRNESKHSYVLAFTSTKTVSRKGNWFMRWFHRSSTVSMTDQLTINVISHEDTASISIQGDASNTQSVEAAQRVKAILRERLS